MAKQLRRTLSPSISTATGRRGSVVRRLAVLALAVAGIGGLAIQPAQADHYYSGRHCGIGPGTLAGAALGGFAGSHIGSGSGRLAATALGVFLGSAIGSSADCRSYSAPRRHRHRHRDADSYYYYQPPPRVRTTHIITPAPTVITPPPTVTVAPEPACREFTSEAVIAGEVQQIFGTACQQSDGSWRIVHQEFY